MANKSSPGCAGQPACLPAREAHVKKVSAGLRSHVKCLKPLGVPKLSAPFQSRRPQWIRHQAVVTRAAQAINSEGWTIDDATELYRIDGWGAPYFRINSKGNIAVRPLGDECEDREIDVLELLQSLGKRGLSAPLLLRFPEIVCDRVRRLQECFDEAIYNFGYESTFQGVFPVKCNHDRHVLEAAVSFGSRYAFGLEAGSKPELLIAMSVLKRCGAPGALLICNGYKDEDYITTALLSQQLGVQSVIVMEKIDELALVLRVSAALGVRPTLGVRAKLSTRHKGHWGSTSGDGAKFGLNVPEMVQVVEELRKHNMLDCLQLLHFHIGSQIPSISIIKEALREASYTYCELYRMGAQMGYVDVGGGLAVNYDGTQSAAFNAMDYTTQNYANDVVAALKDACALTRTPHPCIASESGRALASSHSVLVFNIVSGSPSPSAAARSGESFTESLLRDFQELSVEDIEAEIEDIIAASTGDEDEAGEEAEEAERAAVAGGGGGGVGGRDRGQAPAATAAAPPRPARENNWDGHFEDGDASDLDLFFMDGKFAPMGGSALAAGRASSARPSPRPSSSSPSSGAVGAVASSGAAIAQAVTANGNGLARENGNGNGNGNKNGNGNGYGANDMMGTTLTANNPATLGAISASALHTTAVEGLRVAKGAPTASTAGQDRGAGKRMVRTDDGNATNATMNSNTCNSAMAVVAKEAEPGEGGEEGEVHYLDPQEQRNQYMIATFRLVAASVTDDNFQEAYNDAVQFRNEARSLFNLGFLSLPHKAEVEALYQATCRSVLEAAHRAGAASSGDMSRVKNSLAPLYYANLSIFRSAPDTWAIRQLFPVIPLHRHLEKPQVEASIVDITCDSDGKLDNFIGQGPGSEPSKVLRVHHVDAGEAYFLGLFLAGVYQENLGSLHNMFGSTHTVYVRSKSVPPKGNSNGNGNGLSAPATDAGSKHAGDAAAASRGAAGHGILNGTAVKGAQEYTNGNGTSNGHHTNGNGNGHSGNGNGNGHHGNGNGNGNGHASVGNGNGYNSAPNYIVERIVKGQTTADVIATSHHDADDIMELLQLEAEHAVAAGSLDFDNSQLLLRNIEKSLASYTYLNPPGAKP
eukprot:jgi/Mesvir1/16652/Mv10190-RA.2